jgi:transposase
MDTSIRAILTGGGVSMEYIPRRKLTREFKLEAVRQVALSEKPKAQLARELGVRVGQLRTWRLEFEKEAVTGITKPDRSTAEDLEQLRRENAKLKMEIEILKNVWSAPVLQALIVSEQNNVCVNVFGLLVQREAAGLDGISAHRAP